MLIKHEKTKENAIYMHPGGTFFEKQILYLGIITNHFNINDYISLKCSSDWKGPEKSWNSGGGT